MTSPETVSIRRCLRRVPATMSMPTTIAARTIDVPMSGWVNTSTSGRKAAPSTRTRSLSVGSGVRTSERIAASITITHSLVISDGVICTPAMENQRWAIPLGSVAPIPGIFTSTSATKAPA